MNYSWLVALHIIFIVTWFAGLFYIVRLFIYHTEALQKAEPDRSILANQFIVMEKRLMHIIATPSMILVLITGISLIGINSSFLSEDWMLLKLLFVFCTLVYHFICLRRIADLEAGKSKWTSQRLRMFNELATIFLVGIVFLIELKNTFHMLYGLGGLIAFSLIMMIAIRLYRKSREKKKAD